MSNHQVIELLVFNFDLRLSQFVNNLLIWIFNNLLVIRRILENWIITPSTSSFHHDTIKNTTNDSKEDVLVASEGENEHADAVVMNMHINCFSLLEIKPNSNASSPEAIPLGDMQSMILFEKDNNQ